MSSNHENTATRSLTPEEVEEERNDAHDFERCMDHVRAHAAGEIEGLQGPDSVTWMIYREPVTLVGALPAILLQMAHPAIADGVTRYSNFRTDVLGRARRTLASLYELCFGSLTEVLAASRRLHRIHGRVRGTVQEPGAPTLGRRYRANDQRLLRWVAVTVDIAMLATFETFVRPLTPEEALRFRREAVLGRAAGGVLPTSLPQTEPELGAWYEEALNDPELHVGPTAKSIAHALFNSLPSKGRVDGLITTALLPPRFREAYGLPWGRKERLAFSAIVGATRGAHALLRPPYRYTVAWHQAQMRLAQARGERAGLYARCLNALDRRFDLPTGIDPITPDKRADAAGAAAV